MLLSATLCHPDTVFVTRVTKRCLGYTIFTQERVTRHAAIVPSLQNLISSARNVCVCVCARARVCVCVCVCSLSLNLSAHFPRCDTADAEIKLSSVETPELSTVMMFKPRIGQNIALYVSPAVRNHILFTFYLPSSFSFIFFLNPLSILRPPLKNVPVNL